MTPYMKFDNAKANKIICEFYFSNHPDIHKSNADDYDDVLAYFFVCLDHLIQTCYRKKYPNMTQKQIDYFIDTIIYNDGDLV